MLINLNSLLYIRTKNKIINMKYLYTKYYYKIKHYIWGSPLQCIV